MKKREKYEEVLKGVEILATVDNYEISQIADAVRIEKFSKDSTIIKEVILILI